MGLDIDAIASSDGSRVDIKLDLLLASMFTFERPPLCLFLWPNWESSYASVWTSDAREESIDLTLLTGIHIFSVHFLFVEMSGKHSFLSAFRHTARITLFVIFLSAYTYISFLFISSARIYYTG